MFHRTQYGYRNASAPVASAQKREQEDWIAFGVNLLSEKMTRELAHLEIEAMLVAITGKSRAKLLSESRIVLSPVESDMLVDFIERRLFGEPFHYIVGEKEFYSRRFFVNPNVLIPRPETEELVEWVLDHIKECNWGGGEIQLLDIGTGSGVIPITIVREALKIGIKVRAVATDISHEAIGVAMMNAKTYECSEAIQFRRTNLFSGLGHLTGALDLIVSNPPYIRRADLPRLSTEVRDFEPRAALDGGEDGLRYLRSIAENARRFLSGRGTVFLETAEDSFERLRSRLSEYSACETKRDLSGKMRFLKLMH